MVAIMTAWALVAGGVALASQRRVYVASEACGGHAYRPSLIIIACGDGNLRAEDLSYSSYGGAEAVATGRLIFNNCTPDCVDGTFHSYPGRIRLTHIASCQGRLYYFDISWRFLDGSSPLPSSTGTQDISPSACPPF